MVSICRCTSDARQSQNVARCSIFRRIRHCIDVVISSVQLFFRRRFRIIRTAARRFYVAADFGRLVDLCDYGLRDQFS